MSAAAPMPPEAVAERETNPVMFHVEHHAETVADADDFARLTGASDSAMADMELYRALLAEASEHMNLVGPSALAEFWPRHAWDSAQLLPLLDGATTVADIGAGAGFPGVVLAVLLKGRADARVHLVESVAKRCRFLQSVVDALELPALVHHGRAEALAPPPRVQVVTARACAPLPRLLDFAAPFLQAGARGLFLKGRSAESEYAEALKVWRLKGKLVASRSDPSGRIVVIEEAARVRR